MARHLSIALTTLLAGAFMGCSSEQGSSGEPKSPTPPATDPTPTRAPDQPAPPKTDPGANADAQPEPAHPTQATTPTPPANKAGHNFIAEAQLLSQMAACTELSDPSKDSRTRKRLCDRLNRAIDRYRKRWLERALPRLAGIVPADIPTTVVYPFGGGDLLTALATFPKATEITTLSLELPGDVRAITRYQKGKLKVHLENSHLHARHLLQVAHSKTSNMRQIMRSDLPGQLIFGLIAMRIHDHEPVSLRYFRLNADGTITYKSKEEIETELAQATRQKARSAVFANAEIEFRKKGDASASLRVWRHIGANLDNKHLEGSPILAHLKSKGTVTAMTKAASYLLWWKGFQTIRDYLLDNMVWMISDSTGIPPGYAEPRGFEQVVYGKFTSPFLNAGNGPTKEFRKLYRAQPHRKITFRFGYPDGSKNSHLIVTRRKSAPE